MTTNVAGGLAFAKRISMCCLSLSLISTNVAGCPDFAKCINMHVLFIFTSHVYKRSKISGFCKMYQHVLSISLHLMSTNVAGCLDLAKRINMRCLSLRLCLQT